MVRIRHSYGDALFAPADRMACSRDENQAYLGGTDLDGGRLRRTTPSATPSLRVGTTDQQHDRRQVAFGRRHHPVPSGRHRVFHRRLCVLSARHRAKFPSENVIQKQDRAMVFLRHDVSNGRQRGLLIRPDELEPSRAAASVVEVVPALHRSLDFQAGPPSRPLQPPRCAALEHARPVFRPQRFLLVGSVAPRRRRLLRFLKRRRTVERSTEHGQTIEPQLHFVRHFQRRWFVYGLAAERVSSVFIFF